MSFVLNIENKAALRTAITLVLTLLLAFKFHMKAPFWSGMTVIIVAHVYMGPMVKKALLRVLGTLLGAILGFWIAGMVANSFFTYLLACFSVMAIAMYYYQTSGYAYAYLLGGITAFLVIAQLALDPEDAFFVAIWRSAEISLGVVMSLLGGICLFPQREEPEKKSIGPEPGFTMMQHCLQVGSSVTLATLLWLWSDWPGGLNGIVSSIVISIRKNISQMVNVSLQRLLGCLLGGGTALVIMFFFELSIEKLIVLLFFFVWIFSYCSFKYAQYSYIPLQANIAMIITLAQEGGPPVELEPPLERLGGIVIGILASFIVASLLSTHRTKPRPSDTKIEQVVRVQE